MSDVVRALKVVAASRQRARKRLEAEMLRLRRKLRDAQSEYAAKREAVQLCRNDEDQLATRIAELTESGFSVSARMAMGHLKDVLAGKTANAQTDAAASKKKLGAERAALDQLARQTARNRQQVDMVESKVTELVRQEELDVEDAESDEIEESAAAGLAMRLQRTGVTV
jgi:hypothetical protein